MAEQSTNMATTFKKTDHIFKSTRETFWTLS